MRTWVHFAVSLIIVLVLYPFFSWKVMLILISGVLIDIDHYFWYIYKCHKLSLLDCYKHFTVEAENSNWKNVTGILLIFHTIEFLLIIIFLSFNNQIGALFLAGLLPHYILDIIWLFSVPKRFLTNHSIIHWYTKNKIQKF